jgi:formylglycine-generating enzyme required for sulfatase activity
VTAAQAGTTAFADTVGPLNTALFTEEQIERIASVLNSSFPTEAEWEYACRAGTTSVFWFGNSIPLAPELIRILGLEEPLLANAFGLSSLFFGEWCSDFWTGSHSADAPIEHAAGRVIKGGAARFWPWHDTREWSGCVSSFRMPSIDTGGAGAAVRLVRRIG